MGMNASCDLVWGVLVEAYERDVNGDYTWDDETDTYKAQPWWSNEDGDWNFDKLPEGFDFEYFGDFQYGQEEPQAVLRPKSVKRFRGDAYTPGVVPNQLPTPTTEAIEKMNASMDQAGLDLHFYEAKWYLLASYG
jgi:hypothetical protein